MTDLPTSRRADIRPVYRRLLEKRHHMIRGDEPPSVAEISDAQRLISESTWDDDLREEAFLILRLAGLGDDD